MIRRELLFREMNQIQEFNNIAGKCGYDVDLQQGKYLIDAKSIMGIFSLDIARPVVLVLHTDEKKELKKFEEFFYIITKEKGEKRNG